MKKFLSFLLIICLGCTGLLFGCNEGRYDNLSISIRTEQERAADGSITLYVGDAPQDIYVTMAGAPKDFNYVPHFSLSEEIVSIGSVNHMIKNGVRKTIEGRAPGTTVLTAVTSEGSKVATLKINVIKKAESIAANPDYKLGILNVPGNTITIDTGSAISIYPKDSNQNTIKYTMETPGLADVVAVNGNTITALDGITTTILKEFTLKAEVVNHLGEVNPNVDPAYVKVRIIDNITTDDIKTYESKNNYESVAGANPILTTLVLSKNYVENNSVYVFIGVRTSEEIVITPPENLSSSPVMIAHKKTFNGTGADIGVKYFAYSLQAIRYSETVDLNFGIHVKGYENLFNFSTTISVKCELYIKYFSVNDVTLVDEASHEVTLYTNDQTSGSSIKIAVSNPKEILAKDAKFFIQMYDRGGNLVDNSIVNRNFIITNTVTNANGLSEDGYEKNASFYIKINGTNLTVDQSGVYRLVITAEQPIAFANKAKTEIILNIVEGIKSIDSITYNQIDKTQPPVDDEPVYVEVTNTSDPIKINYTGNIEEMALEVSVDTKPNTETSYETLYAESSNTSIFTVEKVSKNGNKFVIYPQSIGDAEIRFGSKNLTSVRTYKIHVYEDIENFFLTIDSFSQANFIGEAVLVDNSLVSTYIKTGTVGVFSQKIKLDINTIPSNARFFATTVEVTNKNGEPLGLNAEGYIADDYFRFSERNMTFEMKYQDKDQDNFYTVKITLINNDGDVIERSFVVKAYVPITRLTTTLTNYVLYNPNNLGYFDLHHPSKTYTKTQVSMSVNEYATNGTQANIKFRVVADGKIVDNLLIANGNEFSLNPEYKISKYPKKVYLTAYALEFGKEVTSEPAVITIKDPVTVESMSVDSKNPGDINGDILYFKLGRDAMKEIIVTLNPSINLFNSGIKWVQYAEGTTTVLDFADNGGGMMTSVDTANAIFSVEADKNSFKIIAKQAGNARLILIPEDKIKDIDESKYIYDWNKVIELFVSVADGSRQNPYHVSSYKDFKEIEAAMDKFYVLTSDIAVSENWLPLGYSTKTPLNGGINGLYSRIINAETGEKYSVQYDINNISYAVPDVNSSNVTHYGVVYQLGDGIVEEPAPGADPIDKAILENLVVEYSYIQGKFAQDFIFGGIVAINKGTIYNSRVTMTNININLQGMNYYIGGMVGINEGGSIDNSLIDNAVNATINIELSADTFISANIGGIVGQLKSGILNGYQKDYSELGEVGITFGDQGYDAVLNLNVTTSKTYASDLASGVGGVVGSILNSPTLSASISDFAVTGRVSARAIDNVGGIVGFSNAVTNKDSAIIVSLFNNTNNAKIFGRTHVGGVVGKAINTSFNYCSAENYKESQTTTRPFITGKDFVGGFGGRVETSNITNSYMVTYFQNPAIFSSTDITDANSDIICDSTTDSAESYVGGFVAFLSLQESNIVNKVATIANIYVKTNSKINSGGIFGYFNGIGSVDNILGKGYISDGANVFGGASSVPIGSHLSYYSTFNKVNQNEYAEKGTGAFAEGTWKTDVEINDGLPYLLDDAGNILFAFLPITIEVIVENNDSYATTDKEYYDNQGYIYISDNTALLYLNELNSGELTAEQLQELNSYHITDFAQLKVIPWTLKTSRLVITSSNTSVVRVSGDSLIALTEGYARITISSKLNADFRCEFYVVVQYGFNNYGLYETSNLVPESEVSGNEEEAIEMVVDKKVALYESATYTRDVDGNDYQLKANQSAYVRFELENDAFKDSFIINTNWVIDLDTYTDVAISTLTTIYSKLITNDTAVKVTATPFINLTYFSFNETKFFSHLQKSFYIKVVNGADNIYFESSISPTQGIEITQLQSFVFTVIMDTDTEKDEILNYVKDGEGNIVDIIGGGTEAVIVLVKNSEATLYSADGKEIIGKKSTYTVSYEITQEELEEDKKFVITFYSKLVTNIEVSLPITVKPQSIVSADIGVYSNKNDYNSNNGGATKDGTDKFIFNGQVGLLTVEIYPDFSKFNSFDIVYKSSTGFPISLAQLSYNKEAIGDDDPFDDYGDGSGEYITGYGIKVDKASGSEPLLGTGTGKYSYSMIYYFSMLVGSEVPDLTTFELKLVFYDSDKNIVEPLNITYTFQSLSSPQIDLSVKDSRLNNNLPLGTKNEINVSTQNFTGNIAWEISIDSNGVESADTKLCSNCMTEHVNDNYSTCIACMNENYALLDALAPTMAEDGKYYLNLPKDNFDLLGRFIIIKGTIEKSESNEKFVATDEIRVYVSLFTVIDMSVEGLSSDTLKLQIYTPYALKVNLATIYSEDVDYKNHPANSAGYTIANKVSKLKEEISKAAIWKALEGELTLPLIKNSSRLYNASYSCIAYGDYYALYGEEVDKISTITATAKVGFEYGIPTYMEDVAVIEEPLPPVVEDTSRSEIFSRQFMVSFTYQNDIKNPIPISSAKDFLEMEEGKDYRLTSDIMLTDYTPLETRILSLDGNGHTIYIASFAQGVEGLYNYGLFGTLQGANSVQEATMIYNLNVHYISNVKEKTIVRNGTSIIVDGGTEIANGATATVDGVTIRVTSGDVFVNGELKEITGNGEINYVYILPKAPEAYPQPVNVDVTNLTTYNFGGIAAVNQGIITNCSVTGIFNATIDASSEDVLESSYVGGITGINEGYVTSSKVLDFELSSVGSIGGVVGNNSSVISTTYTDEIRISNLSKNTELFYTGGFVCDNELRGKILESYTQGRRTVNDVTIVNTGLGLYTSGTAGGFVYRNSGNIHDCYSNIAITASLYSAGFVFLNEGDEAIVNNCYSISRVALRSKAASPFTGIGKSGGVTVIYEGVISNCFYLKDDYNNFTNEPATRIQLSDFATSASFGSYNIRLNVNTPEEAEGYSWYIAGGKPRLTQTDIETISTYTYMGKTKNYAENSEIYFKLNSEKGKWFAYNATTGFDETKEIIISRRAMLVYYIGADDIEYYFKPAKNGEEFLTVDIPSPTKPGEFTTQKLYNTIDSATSSYYYYLSENVMKRATVTGEGASRVFGPSTNAATDIPVNFSYLDEIYTEENGILHGNSRASIWKNVDTEISYYKRTSASGEYENFTLHEVDQDPVYRFIYDIEITSVLYNDGGTSTLIDLSLDSEGECDLTYILTEAEYRKKYNTATVPTLYSAYGGGYSYRSLDSIQYHYYVSSDVLGSKTNPYLIYDVVSYNTYFTDKFNGELKTNNLREYYRFVANIDFDFENISTSSKVLCGFVEGNGMTAENITLTYVSGNQETVAFGLFAQSVFSMVNNLNLEVIEIASSAHTYVGGLVGWARTDLTTGDSGETLFNGQEFIGYGNISGKEYLKRNYFNNINVFKIEDSDLDNVGLVLGRNIVGGAIGYMTGNTKANNIRTSVNVNSVYVMVKDSRGKYATYQRLESVSTDEATALASATGFSVTEDTSSWKASDWSYLISRNVSYAGLAIGAIDTQLQSTDNSYKEEFSIFNVTVSGEVTGAGGIIGGVVGILAKNSVAYNINLLIDNSQSIRGLIYSGGLIGENRGTLKSSAIKYTEEKDINITLVTDTRANEEFFNNNASTIAIGGLVGFNNGGKIYSAISHIDVRNSLATVAGGAVGRSIAGEYAQVIATGSIRAKSIMGGFTGTSNTRYSMLSDDGIGRECQIKAYAADNSNDTTVTSAAISSTVDTDTYTSCIAANNWQLDDYPYLTEKEAIKRVAGGFIGSEALTPDYYVEIENEDDPTVGAMKIYSEFKKCFFTSSLYYGSAGETVSPSYYMPIAYISDFDTVRLYTTKLANPELQDFEYMYPFLATNQIARTIHAGSEFNIMGLTHYEIAYGVTTDYTNDRINNFEVSGSNYKFYTKSLYPITISETNHYSNSLYKSYYNRGRITFYDEADPKKEDYYGFTYTIPKANLNEDNGYIYIETLDKDGVTVAQRELKVIEKYFVYKDFYNSTDFTIGENFFGKTSDEKYTLYPDIYIQSSSLQWQNYAGTEFTTDLQDGYYLIENAADLATLAYVVNNNVSDSNEAIGGTYRDANHKYKIKEGVNIDLSGKYWEPIGTATYPFLGTFDGNGQTVSNANMSEEGARRGGLFGIVSGAKVRNLTVSGGSITAHYYAGGIIGYAANNTLIENCINENSVTGNVYVGGILGYGDKVEIKNCNNRGKLTYTDNYSVTGYSSSYVGGIAGYIGSAGSKFTYTKSSDFREEVNTGSIVVTDYDTDYTLGTPRKSSLYVGGFAGYINATISIADTSKDPIVRDIFAYNRGDITIDTNNHNIRVGGAFASVVDQARNGLSTYAISNIRNSGDISISNANSYSETSSTSYKSANLANAYIGGVIGEYRYAKGGAESDNGSRLGLFANDGSIYFDNQKSSKSISAIGGIIGAAYTDVSSQVNLDQSYNSGDIETRVNSGELNITVGVGGIVGSHIIQRTSGTTPMYISNCYNMGNISSSGTGRVLSGGIYGVTIARNSQADTTDNGVYAVGNNLLQNDGNVTGSHAYVSYTYNTGSITGARSNTYGLGAILGYSRGASTETAFNSGIGRNYFLAGSAAYAHAEMAITKVEDEDGEEETVTNITITTTVRNQCEQKTSNTLKLQLPTSGESQNIGIDLVPPGASEEDSLWEQKVTTWYPTLKSNYETLYWEDKYTELSVAGDSFTIDNAEQLSYLSYAINNGIINSEGVKFTLTTNIDMANRYFTPIGTMTFPFKGIFNGDGYSINNITINEISATTINSDTITETAGALFGYVNGGSIRNTGLVSPIISGVDFASAFAYSLNNSTMEYCYSDNYEIADPAVASKGVDVRFKAGLISSKKETSGLVNNLTGSTINTSYVNVALKVKPDAPAADVEPEDAFKPSLAGFAIDAVSSTISNSYISNGIPGGPSGLFEYNTYNNGSMLFDKFVINSTDSAGLPIETIYHCYNLTGGRNNFLTKDGHTSGNDIPGNMVSYGVGPAGGQRPTPTNLQDLGWDVVDIWSYEYSLLGTESDNPSTIRGLGQNWYNTECNDIILRNAVGDLITEREEGAGSENNNYIYYEINTAEELAWIARMINSGKITAEDANGQQYVFKLMRDIDLLGKYWTPIGTMEHPFSCEFNFNGYSISNLVIDANNMSFAGLFGYTQDATISGGFIKNAYINVDITSDEYNELTDVKGLYMGGLVAKGNNTNISDIEVDANIAGYSKYNAYVGGLAGNLTFAKSTSSSNAYMVRNIKVKIPSGSFKQILIPADFRKSNGFGIDETITEDREHFRLAVNVAGFSITSNSYVGGVVGYMSGKYTLNYQTKANLTKAYNEAVVVSYSKADIARSYTGGIVGYMTENSYVDTVKNAGSVKSATYGYDYIGGVAGIIDAGSEIKNALNKGYIECSQFASVISYSGGISGFIRGGSTASNSANLGTSYKNIDSTKIFSAGAFGYVEKDVTGTMPTIRYVVYTDELKAYEDLDQNSKGYYGDGELKANDGAVTVKLVVTLEDDGLGEAFKYGVTPWSPSTGDINYY